MDEKPFPFVGISAERFLSLENEPDFPPINGPKLEDEISEFSVKQQEQNNIVPSVVAQQESVLESSELNHTIPPCLTPTLDSPKKEERSEFSEQQLHDTPSVINEEESMPELTAETPTLRSPVKVHSSDLGCQLCNAGGFCTAGLNSEFAQLHRTESNSLHHPAKFYRMDCKICGIEFNSMASYLSHRTEHMMLKNTKKSCGRVRPAKRKTQKTEAETFKSYQFKESSVRPKLPRKCKLKINVGQDKPAKGKPQKMGPAESKKSELAIEVSASPKRPRKSRKQNLDVIQDDDVLMKVDPSNIPKNPKTLTTLPPLAPTFFRSVKNRKLDKFICTICDQEFDSREDGNEHYRKVHTVPLSNQIHCRMCRADFDDMDSYQAHRAKRCRKNRLQRVKIFPLKKVRKLQQNSGTLEVVQNKPEIQKPQFRKQNLELSEVDKEVVVINTVPPVPSEFETPRGFAPEVLARIPTGPRSRKQKLHVSEDEEDDGLKIRTYFDPIPNPKPKVFICEKCGKEFSRHSALLFHNLAVHKRKKMFSCKHCGKTFRYPYSLCRHRLMHHNSCHRLKQRDKEETPIDYEFFCDDCGKGFASRICLSLHVRVHTGAKPYVCTFCGKCFADKTNRRVHSRMHTGDRPYICNICGERFATSSNHKTHLVTHCIFGDSARGI